MKEYDLTHIKKNFIKIHTIQSKKISKTKSLKLLKNQAIEILDIYLTNKNISKKQYIEICNFFWDQYEPIRKYYTNLQKKDEQND